MKKFQDYKSFYSFYEKYFNFVGKNTIKKISKLYDMAKDVNERTLNYSLTKDSWASEL